MISTLSQLKFRLVLFCRHVTHSAPLSGSNISWNILSCRDLLSLASAGHLADSEGDNGDVELDDEDSVGDERYNSSSSHNLSSFKRGGLPPAPPGLELRAGAGAEAESRRGLGRAKIKRSTGELASWTRGT